MTSILPPAARLREFRALTRIGYREFAALLGVHRVTLNRYECGRLNVPAAILDRIESWNPDEIGRPVPTVTWTRGNPFKPRRRR